MAWFPEESIQRIIERETPRTIEFYTDASSIVLYEHQISPSPPGWLMSIQDTPAGVIVSFPQLSGVFPIQYVDYVTADNEVVRVSEWGDIPEGVDICSYRPDLTITAYTFSITVTAINNLGAAISSAWQIDINNDWKVERENFLEALNASS